MSALPLASRYRRAARSVPHARERAPPGTESQVDHWEVPVGAGGAEGAAEGAAK